jgi:dipeptidyl aminopeptidase/acylaminoacyl peptidase
VGLRPAFAGGGGLPAWDRSGHALLVNFQNGAEGGLGRLEQRDNVWQLTPLVQGGLGSAVLAPDATAFAFTLSQADRPAALYLLTDLHGRTAEPRRLEDPDAGIAERWLLASPQDAACTGPEGDRLEAWWFAPLRRLEADGAIPVVLYYYGGSSPRSRSFNFTHQWLAANGFAVLVVNPRGAYGYGEAFADVHAGDWGPQAAADILACLDTFLAAHPELDEGKVGIYGGSYGGFMTEYLVTVSDRFAAAVSMYGISDIATYWGQGAWGWTYGDMASAGALPWTDPDLYLHRSPLFRADRIRTPLLLLHGLADLNVTPGESEQLFTALAVQDKPVELVLFPGEGHGISGSFANLEAHRTMLLEWFDRWLRNQPEAWEERWKAE